MPECGWLTQHEGNVVPRDGVLLGGVAVRVDEDGHLVASEGKPVVSEAGDKWLQLAAGREQLLQPATAQLQPAAPWRSAYSSMII